MISGLVDFDPFCVLLCFLGLMAAKNAIVTVAFELQSF